MPGEDNINGWKDAVSSEIASVKPYFIQKHNWKFITNDWGDCIFLYVEFQHSSHPERVKVLRLRYGPNFPKERPREDFVDPNDYSQVGTQHWIDDGQRAFKSQNNPPVICLEGTWGFHHQLHRDRPIHRVLLTKLFLEIQKCLNETS